MTSNTREAVWLVTMLIGDVIVVCGSVFFISYSLYYAAVINILAGVGMLILSLVLSALGVIVLTKVLDFIEDI